MPDGSFWLGSGGIVGLVALFWAQWRYWGGRFDTIQGQFQKDVGDCQKDIAALQNRFEEKLERYVPRHEHESLGRSLQGLDTKMEAVREKADQVQVVQALVISLDKKIDDLIVMMRERSRA